MGESSPSRTSARRLRLLPPPKSETTAEYLERWLRGRRSLRPATFKAYNNHITIHLLPHIGPTPLDKLDVADLEAMYDVLLSDESGLSIASVHQVHATLNSALNRAVRAGLIGANPARLVDLPRSQASRPKPWAASELVEFLHLIEEDPLHPLFALLGLRGLRRGEALGLRWSNLNLARGEVHVREQLAVSTVGYAVGPTKSMAGVRTVAIDDSLAELLAKHSVAQREAGIRSEFVFSDSSGKPLRPAYVTRYFDRLVRQTGMRRITLHTLRHTSATLGLASGESLLEVSRRLGHSSVAITADLYTEIPPETAHASAERLAAYLRIESHN
jgi:integrase